ncbi:hypothetical protein [Actinomyces oris]|uniref:hypothetical protein n=1 Tax=Actinomyces oris TaxID=544580 RepID=UPI0028527554|nr:hypothetical protein [Actinomyces oris]
MRKYRPTFNDTALARRSGGTLVPHRAFTALRIISPIFVFIAARIYSLTMPAWLSWGLAILLALATAIAITAKLIPSEVEGRRVLDLRPNDLIVPSKEIKLFPNAFPVLHRNSVLDVSPQEEVILAGCQNPIIYGPDDTTLILEPIGVEPRQQSPEEDEAIHRVLDAAAELDDTWLNRASEEDLRMARRLGLVERKPLRRDERWSKAARSYANASRAKHTGLQQDKLTQTDSVIVIVNGDLMLQIDGQEQRIADLVDHLSEKVTQLTDRAIVERIRVAVEQKDKHSTAQGLRELGQDTLVNALGAASGNALWTAVLTAMQHFW